MDLPDLKPKKTILLTLANLRLDLQLDQPPYNLVTDDLLTIALTDRSYWGGKGREKERQRYLNQYQVTDYQMFEFLGDAVLELIATNFLTPLSNREITADQHLALKRDLVSNRTLAELGSQLNLCAYLRTTQAEVSSKFSKACADLVEALLGVLFYQLYPQYGYLALNYINQWFLTVFQLDQWLASKLANNDKLKTKLETLNLPADLPLADLGLALGWKPKLGSYSENYWSAEMGYAVYKLYLTQDLLNQGYSIRQAHLIRQQYSQDRLLAKLGRREQLCARLTNQDCSSAPLAVLGVYYWYMLDKEGYAKLDVLGQWFFSTFELEKPGLKK